MEFGNFRGIKSVSNPTPQKGGQTLELGGFGIWASAFIADNDDPPTLFVSPGEVDEPDDGETATLQYRVQLSNPSARTVTVDYAEDSGSGQKDPATSGTDYTALTAGTLTFLPGEFRKTVDIEVTGDYDEEPDESVTVQFSNPVNACFPGAGNCPSGPITSTGIIHNDDQNLKLSFTLDDPTIVEGEDAVLRLTISHPIGYDVMAGVSTVDGTATAGSDFKAAGRMGYSVRVPKGSTEATQSVPVLADSVSGEGIEKFSFNLDTLLLFPEGDPVEETPPAVADQQKLKEIFGSGFAVADIRTNSPMPTASIVDGPALSVAAVKDTVTEGWPAQFEVTLDPPAATDVTFTWKTGDGGLDDGGSDAHKAKAGKDYTSTTATTVTIPAGATSVSLPEIPTLQDTVDEMDQQFMVVLESITGAVADEQRGVVTIRDDDSRPWISIADATVEEGGELSFTITLEGTSENEVSVLWVTEDDTATTLDHDYVGVERRRTVNFAPGEQTKTITVQTLEDRVPETTERFKVQLAHARHAKYRDPTAVGTITDNGLMEISIADAAPVTEGSGAAAEFTVTLTPEQTSPVTIQWRTEDGPGGGFYVAKSGGAAAEGLNDFTAVQSGSLTFAAGETEKTVSVTILDDTAYESIERFGVVVSGDETAMVIRNPIAYGEIQDDDAVNLIMHQPLPAVVEEGKTYVVHFKLPARTEDDFWQVGRLGFINCSLDNYSFLGFPHPGTPLSEANVRDFALAHSKDGVSGEGKLDPANAGYYINYPCSGVAKQEGVTAHIFAEYVSTLEEHNFAVFVRIDDDSISEDNEIASMWLIGHGGEFWSTMSPHLLWNGFALTTIIVDNDRPQASVSDVRVGEDAGNAILTISLSQASTEEVRVSYETRDGTAIAGRDYGNQDNTVTFSPGETEKTISIPINADHLVEPLPETFTVALKDPSEGLLNVHPVGGEATVTITDSTERTMTIPDRVVDEGEDVEILAKFSDPIAYGVGWFNRIAIFFRDDGLSHPATANDDYVEFDGNLLSETTLLLDGNNRVAKTLTTNEDSAIETDEDIGVYARFTIPISQGLVYDSSRTSRITIRDDDHASLMIAGLDSAGDVTVKAGQIWTAPTPSITGRPLGHVTWTLEGDDADDFSIDPDTGEVTLSDRDFEKPTDKDKNNIYSATVRATDEDGNTDTAAVQVTAGGRSLVLSKNSVTVAEKAGTDSFTVALDSQPTGDITVALTTTGETGALTLDQTELTFKPGDWNQAQTVTVTGVDDKVDNADDKREASITLVASGRGFSATVEYTVAATVTDDDDRGITFSKKALSVAENGGTDSYTIVLDTQPTGDVTVTVRGVNTAPLLSVDTATLVFGPDDWDQPQTVTFTGGNDDLDNLKNPRYVITHGAQHADYEGFAAGSVIVTVTDDDVRGVTISKDSVEVNAGDTAEYTVVLNSQPHPGDGVVTIKLEVLPKARGATDSQFISPTTLTFDSGNWNTPQTVTITGVKPSNLAPLYEIRHQVSGADYTGVKAGAVQVANRDKDHALTGDDLTVKSSSATEGEAVVFSVTRRDDTVPALNWRTEGYPALILPPLTKADPDSDYTSNYVSGGNIVRFEGKDTVTLSVPTTDDDLDEVNEAFSVGIVSYIDKNQGTEDAESLALNHRYAVIGTIIDDDAAALSVAAPAVEEGEKAQVTISLSNPSINDVTVKWNTAADTRDDASPATAGTDYTAVSPAQTVTIKAGATSAIVEVQTTEDSALEGDETFLVQLSSPTNAALPEGAATAVVTITDNDGAPTVSVGNAAAVTEGNAPKTTVDMSFPVTLSAVSGQKVTVTYALSGTATAYDDYADPAAKSVSIAAGTRTANLLVPVKGDLVDELNETVTVTLSGATNATVSAVEGAGEGEGTITDDDAAQLSIADASAAEGSAVSFTIGLDPVSDRTVTVKWNTANDASGTHPATAGTDYTAVSPARTATIAAGASSVAVTVQTTQDTLDEPDETFLVELSSPVNATLATGKDQATGTITDNDPTPTVSVGNAAAVTEGNAPKTTVDMSFPVTLSAVSGQKVTVTYALSGTATAYDDYADPAAKSVSIAAGTRTANILIPVKGDLVDERNETIIVTLSGATNATVSGVEGADEGEGTITDDDAAELSIADGSIAEGGAVSFTIGLDPVSDRAVTVKWNTANDASGDHPASAGTDYTAVSPARTATIAAGASSVVVTVQTTQDSLDEPDETFLVELSGPVNAALASGKDQATGTITDNDGAPTVSVGNAAAVTEGNDPKTTVNLSFPVTLSAVSGQQVTVTYTLGGTATADDDYADPATKSVTIAAGTRTANILVPVKGDLVDELNETVVVTLSGATNATVSGVEGADEGEGTITDDDAAQLSIADGSIAEGGAVSFTIGLDPVSDRTVTVKWNTANDASGDHPAGAADYTAVSPARTATIAAGTASTTVSVQTTQDSLDEPDETFLVELSGPVNAALASGKDQATGTITDNDGAPTVSVGNAAAVTEGNDPKTTVNLSFPVTLSAVSGQQVTVTYTLGGTATDDDDYADPATKSVTIAAGTRTANILIPVKGDLVDERNETIIVTLSGATNATVSGVEGADEGEGTITDDDAAELSIADGSIAEGGAVSFTIGLDPVSDRAVTVKWNTANDASGDHPAGAADYTAVSPARTATIAAGTASTTVSVQTTQDSLDEPDETFLVELSSPVNATLATGKDQATGTITDNDGAPTVSVGNAAAVTEGNDPKTTVNLSFPVTLSAVSGQQVTVTYTLGGTATADDDYADPATKSVTIAAGTRTANILVPVKGDLVDELNETVVVTLSGATNATVSGVEGADEGEGTITDDDAAQLSIADGSIAEGGAVSFTIGLDPVSDRTVTVKWNTANDASGDHPAGAADYTAVSPARTATIAAGTASTTVSVQTTQDSLDEPAETFLVELSSPTNATLAHGGDQATGTIIDNDEAPNAGIIAPQTVSATSVMENVVTAPTITFTVSLTGTTFNTDQTVTVSVGKAGDPAKSGVDYTAVPDFTLTIPAGTGSVQGSFTLDPIDDDLDEADETLTLTAELSGVAIPELTFTITDNDPTPTVSVGNAAAVTEGNAPKTTVDMSFPVTLSAVSGQKVTVTYALSGTATAYDDYADPAAKSVSIAAGTRTANLLVPVKGDVVDELNETVTVTLSGATNATVSAVEGAGEGEGTITDDDAAELSIADGSIAEGGAVSFTIGLDPVSDRTVTVKWNTANDASGDHPASAGTDYTAVSPARTATIAAGASSVVVTVQTTQDSLDEPDETFLVELSSPVNATLATGKDQATGTITDNDGAPTVSVGNAAAVTEGNDPKTTVNLSFPVTLSAVSGQQVTVTYTLGGTATADDDYADPATKSVTIAAGTRTANILVPVKGDLVDELNETVVVTLSGATNATVSGVEGAGEGEGTITDDDAAELSIADGSIAEGSAVSFTIALDPVSDRTVTVKWNTANDAGGTHPATAGTDYTAVSPARTATIAAGAASTTVTVQTTQDSLDEPDETFLVELSSPTNAALATGGDEATGTITDNDGAPKKAIKAIIVPSPGSLREVVENVANAPTMTFTVSLSGTTFNTDQTVTVSVGQDGDLATSGVDYTAVSDWTLTIPAGASNVQGSFTLDPIDDALDEANETLTLTATLPGVDIPDLTFTIIDDDAAPTVSVGNAAAVTEGNDPKTTVNLSFPVTLSAVSGQQVTVTYTLGGTATADDDYADPATKSVTIAAGTRTANILVPVKGDLVDELNETVVVTLSGATNATVSGVEGADEGEGTITDDDAAQLSIADGSIAEGGAVSFTIGLDPVSDRTVTVKWNTANDASGTHPATAGTDYTAVSPARTATIAAGASSVAVTVQTTQDTLDEPDETFLVELSSPVNATLATGGDEATGTITDNDDAPEVSITGGSGITEGGDAEFTVTASPAPGAALPVDVRVTADGYFGVATGRREVTIPTSGSATFTVSTEDDELDEINGLIIGTLQTGNDHTVSPTQGTDTVPVADNDETGPAEATVSFEKASYTFNEDDNNAFVKVIMDNALTSAIVVRFQAHSTDAGIGPDGDVEISLADLSRGELGPRDIIFAPGETSREIMLDLLDDDVVEPDETLTISLSSVSGPVATGAPTTVTLTDDDQAVIRIDPHDSAHPLTVQVEEGGQGTIWVQMNKPHQEDVTMDCVVKGSATPGEDYVTLHHRVTIPAGSEALAVTLNTIDDNLVEGLETFIFIIANPVGSGVSIDPEQSEHTVNIMDNDDSPATPEISITAGSGITEGGDAEFTVKVSPAPSAALPVKVTVVATSGFGAAGTGHRTVTIPTSGSATFTVGTVDDAVDEPDGSITGTLQAGSAYRVSSTQGSATVKVADDDEPVPAEAVVSFEKASYTLDEDDNVLSIKVVMDKPITSEVTVLLRIHSTDSEAGRGEDAYMYPADQHFSFASGETSREIAVYPVDNDMVEPDETFTISIDVVSGPVTAGAPTTVTLTDDDEGVIFIDPQNGTRQVEEGKQGSIGIYMSKSNQEDVTVDFVVGGTATAGADYVALPHRVTIPADATYFVADVNTIDDELGEGTETIEFSLANPVGNSVSLQPNLSDHTMKILDNDRFVPEASIVALTDSIIEGEVAYFKITLDPAPIVSFPVSITTVHSNNYETITSSKIVDVPAGGVVRYEWHPWDDDDHETGETLEMRLNPDATYTVSNTQGSATVNMVDNDLPKPVVSITGGGDITEGDDATFTITASPAHPDAPSADLSVNVSITVIIAYEITKESKTVTVSPGGSATLTIATTDDSLDELDGSIDATLTWGDGYTVSRTQGSATVNVIDNDWPKPVVSITGGSDIAEGGDAEFTITAGPAHPDAPTADLSVNIGIEVAGDYGVTTESETVTVSPGGSATLTIATAGDTLDELDGSITATLESGEGYTVSSAQGSATVNVVDDDLPKPVVSISGGSGVTEGGNAEFTITASPAHPDAPAADISVNVSIEGVGDYGVATESETVTVSPGGSATLTIATAGDTLDELDGSITATLESGEGYTVSSTQGTATVNVVDDDLPKPVVSITGGSGVTEGGTAEFTITANPAHPDSPAAEISVNVSIEVVGDYGVTTESETVTVSPGGSATLTIATTDDSLDELDGSIAATLESGEGYTVSGTQGSATVNVVDDDASPTVSVEDASGFEDSFLEFRVTLSEVSGREVQVSWYTLPSESLDNRAHTTDYDTMSGRLVFAPGVTVMTGKVNLKQDTEDEEDEHFTVWLENPDGATIAREKATMTIKDAE